MQKQKKIKAMILDMDGVLWRDNEPIGDLPIIFQSLDRLSLGYSFLTNNSTKTPESYQKKFKKFGVSIEKDMIFTSSLAVSSLLKRKFPGGGPVFIIGEEGLLSALAAQGFFHHEENVHAVVAGLDRTITYSKLSKASLMIQNGALFFGTNPDKTYPAPLGFIPGAGAILEFLKISSGTSPIIAGKPKPFLFQLALRMMDSIPEETLVIGDRIETDLVGGSNIGCQTALVTSGVTSKMDLLRSHRKPDYIFPDLTSLVVNLFE
jgi:4-nitrophenyl phosphatase